MLTIVGGIILAVIILAALPYLLYGFARALPYILAAVVVIVGFVVFMGVIQEHPVAVWTVALIGAAVFAILKRDELTQKFKAWAANEKVRKAEAEDFYQAKRAAWLAADQARHDARLAKRAAKRTAVH
jgi:uncharacterized membrane protein